jgi:putative DNA methylase
VPWEAANDEHVLAEARAEIERSCGGELPRILDPFAGGGTIPLEALRLGLATYASDLNPVAVLIERAMLQIPHRFSPDRSREVVSEG